VHRLPFQDEQWRRGLEDRFRALLAGELRSYEVEHRRAHMSVLPPDTVPMKAVRTTTDLRAQLNRIVDEASECLMCLGSRSREVPYLDRIVAKLTHQPHVAHYRMMWGQPHHEVFITHLRRLLALQALRECQDSSGRIRLGMVAETSREPERFIVANEREALFVIPPEQVGKLQLCRRLQRRRNRRPLQGVCERPLQLLPSAHARRRRAHAATPRRRMTSGHGRAASSGAGDTTPTESILELARALVRIPSRAGQDPSEPAITTARAWLHDHDVPTSVLGSDGAPVAVLAMIEGARQEPAYCLNACLDTAPFGDESAWKHPPASGHVEGGWLHGRGAADSKMAVAIFAHLAAELNARADKRQGRLAVLFDCDEHTGGFAGAKTFLAHHPNLAGAMIGTP